MAYIDESTFTSEFRPMPNPVDGGLIWDRAQDTIGLPADQVWTLVEGDSGLIWALPGYHVVNRIGYVVTEKKWYEPDLEALWYGELPELT